MTPIDTFGLTDCQAASIGHGLVCADAEWDDVRQDKKAVARRLVGTSMRASEEGKASLQQNGKREKQMRSSISMDVKTLTMGNVKFIITTIQLVSYQLANVFFKPGKRQTSTQI